jgi:hypothetical protein
LNIVIEDSNRLMCAMTNKGDMLFATGSGTGESASQNGIVKIRGEGEMRTHSTSLANLYGVYTIDYIRTSFIGSVMQPA